MPDGLEPRFSEWIKRRTGHEPTAYIIGKREFWNLSFSVSPAVLIPRPETELIVEEALKHLPASPRVADIGTGSGCISVSVAHASNATVLATDISEDALRVARTNAAAHGVDARVTFVRTSYLDGVAGPFDVITANPPYVRSSDAPALGRGVRQEPSVALFGGTDGLRDIAGVLDAAERALKPDGWFFMEFGYGQEDDVRRLVSERRSFYLSHVRTDLQGIPRMAAVRKTA